jgi:hypothetical protein
MSAYILPENQRILWNTINKANGFSNDEQWFKQIIALFYQKNANRTLNQQELLQLNKETIEYMMRMRGLTAASFADVAPNERFALKEALPRTPPAPVDNMMRGACGIATASLTADTIQRDNETQTQNQIEDIMNYRHLQDQIDDLRAEIKLLKNNHE